MTAAVLGGPVSWHLERDRRQVTFASCGPLTVYTDTASTPLSAVRAHPAWILLVPSDGGSLTVRAGDVARVDDDAVLLPPQTWHQVATRGPHVAVHLSAPLAPRADGARPRQVAATAARRVLDALAVDSGIDLSSAIAELDPSVRQASPIDPRLAFAIDALPSAHRLDVLAAEIGLSSSRLRALAYEAVGVPLTQLRLWSRLAQAIGLLPYASTAYVAATAGFADQAHLIRTARRLLGRTPAELSPRSFERRALNSRWRASVAAGRRAVIQETRPLKGATGYAQGGGE
jgi:AraC-like DNA-binding protein